MAREGADCERDGPAGRTGVDVSLTGSGSGLPNDIDLRALGEDGFERRIDLASVCIVTNGSPAVA